MISVASSAQCDPDVPTFDVDLSIEPTASWVSPPVVRTGYCCGSTGSDQCLEFVVTLHPNAQGLVFDVCSGAIPGGALFYQVNCGPPQQVGQALCLSGVGPHLITFCKPGNNINEYCLTSIPGPTVSPDINVNEGCSGQMSVSGMNESSIQWNSVHPGSIGQYNSYLDCNSGCDTVGFSAQAGFPDSVQYEVCGLVESSCIMEAVCDTITIYFNSTLEVVVDPAQPIICFGETETTISAVGIGGSPPYNFVWSTGETTEMISVEAGTYSLTVYDDSECLPNTTTVTVTALTSPIVATAMDDITVCYDSGPIEITGSVSGVSTGEWIGGSGSFEPDATSLSAIYTPSIEEITEGIVDLTLVTTQNEQCEPDSSDLQITLSRFDAIVSIDVDSVSCRGLVDGAATVETAGFGAPFEFLWNDISASSSSDLTALGASEYEVLITDVHGCDSTFQVVIEEPDDLLIQSLEIQNVTCFGASNGIVEVTCAGGNSPYEYLWSGPSGTEIGDAISSDLSIGIYSLSISDASNCSIDTVFEIAQPDELVLSLIQSDSTSCSYSEDGIIEVIGFGGIEPYDFQWDISTSNQIGPVAVDLGAGSYQVMITDANQCQDSLIATVLSPLPVEIQAIDDLIICSGSTVEVSALAAGGTGSSYTYSWTSLGDGQIQDITPETDTYYSVWATDQNGCESHLDSVFVSLTTINEDLSATVMNDTSVCQSDLPILLTGSVTGVNTGIWTGGNGVFEPSNTSLIAYYHPSEEEITTGQVTLTLTTTDTDACEPASDNVTISFNSFQGEVSIQSEMVSCNGYADGELLIEMEGGSPPFSFLWMDLSSQGPQVSNLYAGEYEALITDNQGCDTIIHGSVDEPEMLQVSSLSIESLSCFESSDGSVVVHITGGTEPYQYNWATDSGNLYGSSLTDLESGDYDLSLTDGNGCLLDSTITVNQPDPLNVTVIGIDSTSCHLSADGSINAQVVGGTQPYTVDWDPSFGGQTSLLLTDLDIGSYNLNITDANGCRDSVSAEVEGPEELIIEVSEDQLICAGSSLTISAEASGGIGSPYAINWIDLGQGSVQVVTPAYSTMYRAYAVDDSGCNSLMDSIYIEIIDMSDDSLMVAIGQDAICRGDSTVLIAEHLGDQDEYNYSWDQGLSDELGPFVVHPVTDTWYTLVVTDTCGNSIQDMILLEILEVPEISVMDIENQGCAPYEVSLEIEGSHPPNTEYIWDLGNGQSSDQPLTIATYTNPGEYIVSLLVMFDNGCMATAVGLDTLSILNVPTADFVASSYMTTIEDSEITFTSTSSNDVQNQEWDLGDGSSSEEISVEHTYSEEGIYNVNLEVINENGCKDIHSEIIRIAPVHELIIPNAFSPSPTGASDGSYEIGALNNDIFFPWTENLSRFEMLIYNRWGELLFRTNDISQGWNGFYKGVLSQQDVYVYKINVIYTDGLEVERVGNITLYR